ncbi:hypothetical protein Vadar_021444 [Vaccinium darrowii]|uniref:Uncharacterized protein n=1 Tax=Vaccinium darrowii TaxID=229202 RepID=A0ACB7YP39_9ERIC|nr:hypothetical protein Vadar_021444 [Vaccinium darrowii]
MFNNQSGLGQENNFRKNSVEFTKTPFENGAPTLENPFNISQPVDDYSLHYIYSSGSKYCADVKRKGKGVINIDDENPSSNRMKPTSPVLTKQVNSNLNELRGGCNVGGTVQSPLEAQDKSYPKLSECQSTDIWTRIRETSKRNVLQSSSQNFIPKYYHDELKEVSKDEYRKSLQSKKGKEISILGGSALSTTNSDINKYKSILWNAQVCGGKSTDIQASNSPHIDLNGIANWIQTGKTTGGLYSNIQGGGENQTFQSYANSNFTEQSPQMNSNTSPQFWNAQGYGGKNTDTQASNTPHIDLKGIANWIQTGKTTGVLYSNIQGGGENQTFESFANNNFTEQPPQMNFNTSPQLYDQGCQNTEFGTNPSFNFGNGHGIDSVNGNGNGNYGMNSPQLYQGCQNSEFANNPSFNFGNGVGIDGLNGNGNGMGIEKGNGEGSIVILDNEEDLSEIWEDLNPLPPVPVFDEDADCYILPDSQNKSCTDQVIDAGSGQQVGEISVDDFLEGFIAGEGNPNQQSTFVENANVSTMGGFSVEGTFDNEEEAARAYDLVSLKYWGIYATTNFPISCYEEELLQVAHMTDQEILTCVRSYLYGFFDQAWKEGMTKEEAEINRNASVELFLGSSAAFILEFSLCRCRMKP